MNQQSTKKDKSFEMIREHLAVRYLGDSPNHVTIREFLERICLRHLDLGLGDADLVQKLCCGDEASYWQQLSEILLASELLEMELPLTPSHQGPDFLVMWQGKKIWIEVICPRPEGIPAKYLAPTLGEAIDVPHQAILLRWTAAIKEKAEKLLGNAESKTKGYIAKGVVGPRDIYVIAVNARLLRDPCFASITGISQVPFAAEAVFAIGPYSICINRNTLEVIGGEHEHRPMIRKRNGANVPAYTFLDPVFCPISAIWASDIDETWVIGNIKDMAVIHNPNAISPLPLGLLPSYFEYVATPHEPDGYLLERLAGNLCNDLV